MNLGKCPVCKKDGLEIFKSLDIDDDFKRYDLKCETRGCLIGFKEFQYDDRDQLISTVRKSQKLAGVKPEVIAYEIQAPTQRNEPAPSKRVVTHYDHKGKSICGKGKRLTKIIEDVNCGNCENNLEFKKLKS